MATVNNKDKTPVIDEALLDETPPDINEPQTETEDPETVEPEVELISDPEPDSEPQSTPAVSVIADESAQEKERKYRAQQTEAQLQIERNKQITQAAMEAQGAIIPTEADLREYVAKDNQNWDDLTTFEQTMAKKSYIADKRLSIVQDAVQATKKIDEWAQSVDGFIDSTDGKPEYVNLSGHEMDFRKYAMKEAHRNIPLDILLPAFLNTVPKAPKIRGSLFETGSGGDQEIVSDKISDTDMVSALRKTNPREYKRQLKAGKIILEV